MSKVGFRPRALDANRPMPIFDADDLPDLADYAAVNRQVPAMPTGMERDEENELHLQEAISAQQSGAASIIPTPQVIADVQHYEQLYLGWADAPKQLVKVEAALNLEPDIADYDADSDDERWLAAQTDVSPLQFETIMERLEKASERQVATLKEAKLLLQSEDDDVIVTVYDYWLTKRLHSVRRVAAARCYGRVQKHSLMARVKADKREPPVGSVGSGAPVAPNPYVAFRRRAEKMQTRKNRKNDEDSYEKILKLDHDLRKAVTLLEMIKRREKTKKEMVNLESEIFDERCRLPDPTNELYRRLLADIRPSFQFATKNDTEERRGPRRGETKKARKNRADRDEGLASRAWLKRNLEEWYRPAHFPSSPSKDTRFSFGATQGASADEQPDGRFAFKRRRGCRYHDSSFASSSARASSPDCSESAATAFHPTLLRNNHGCLRDVSLLRRRCGRGGRLIFDRCAAVGERVSPSAVSNDRLPSSSPTTGVGALPELMTGGSQWKPSRSTTRQFRPRSPLLRESSADGRAAQDDSLLAQLLVSAPTDGLNAAMTSQPGDNGRPEPCVRIEGPRGACLVPITVGVSAQVFDAHVLRLRKLALARADTDDSGRVPTTSSPVLGKLEAIRSMSACLTAAHLQTLYERRTAVESAAANDWRGAEATSDRAGAGRSAGASPHTPSADHVYQTPAVMRSRAADGAALGSTVHRPYTAARVLSGRRVDGAAPPVRRAANVVALSSPSVRAHPPADYNSVNKSARLDEDGCVQLSGDGATTAAACSAAELSRATSNGDVQNVAAHRRHSQTHVITRPVR